ncbi:hypothetical protein XA68_17355 [Ophiocordyceps unilateralis]|uniref:Uncharacterized protein n=1 Tax=Ophiocordyceps unilateralis TaxID=268505 RepID=A0A2A9PK93_OPHUN|nr:hypothetical protein XA68_17355 [Ophiocordyceps unilateralis]
MRYTAYNAIPPNVPATSSLIFPPRSRLDTSLTIRREKPQHRPPDISQMPNYSKGPPWTPFPPKWHPRSLPPLHSRP